jgi:hypothetical protein
LRFGLILTKVVLIQVSINMSCADKGSVARAVEPRKGGSMDVLTIVRVVAAVCAGLLAGIYFGYRAGAYYALQKLSASSFVQFSRSCTYISWYLLGSGVKDDEADAIQSFSNGAAGAG